MTTIEKIRGLIVSKNNQDLKEMLENNPELAEGKTDDVSLLQFAAYCRNADAVAIIRTFRSQLDIFEMAALGDLDQLNIRIKEDNSVLSAFSGDGFTLLGLASYFGHRAVVELLLEAGADPNVPSANAFQVTPLHSATAISNLEVAELLVRAGADVNAKQRSGVTPLHSAAHNGQLELAELLIRNGADVNARTEAGQSPLQMALERNHELVAAAIAKSGAR
jgi:ankyrin repeat protein